MRSIRIDSLRKVFEMENKILSGLLSAVLALTLLAGCGSSTSGTESAPVDNGLAFALYDMAYVLSSRDEYLGLLEESVQKAADENAVNIKMYYGGEDSGKIIECVNEAREEGKQAVLINLNAAEDAQACIDAAGDMKVVFINRVPSDYSVLNESAVAVASDEHDSGRLQGEFLANYFNNAGKTEISYVLLRGTEGLAHTDLRTDEALSALKEAGITLKEAAVIPANFDRAIAKEAFAELLPDLEYDCIISNNDAMALGAIAALKEAGLDPGAVPIVGIDATADAKEAVKNGEMAMTVYQSTQGQANGSILAAINMLEGLDISEGTECNIAPDSEYVLYYPFVPVTIENVDSIE